MSIQSGKFGRVNGMSTVRNWSLTETQDSKKFAASNTRGGSGRLPGIRDWSGSFGQYGGIPNVLPGESFTFEGFTAPDSGVEGGTGSRRTGTAYAESLVITWNWETNEIISMVTNFSGNGELTTATGATYPDNTEPDITQSAEGSIRFALFGSDSGDDEVICAKTAVLTITAPGQQFSNSCTENFRERKPGTLDWTLAVTMDETEHPNGFNVGDVAEFRLFVNDTDFILLKWGQVKEFTNLNVDIENGTIISQTMNVEMDGVNDGEIGEITIGETTIWPV